MSAHLDLLSPASSSLDCPSSFRLPGLAYARLLLLQHLPVWKCDSGMQHGQHGTRIYRPGVLQPLLAALVAKDPATLFVELDVLTLRLGTGKAQTCALAAMHEDDFRERARRPN